MEFTKLKFAKMAPALEARNIQVIGPTGTSKRYSSANGTIDLYSVNVCGTMYSLSFTQIRRLAKGCDIEVATARF